MKRAFLKVFNKFCTRMATNVLIAAKQIVNLLLTIVGVLLLVIGVVIYIRFAMGLGLGIMGNGVSVSHGTRLKIT